MDKEEAIKILRELHDKVLFSERTALETLHPELKESEDEKIRKTLKHYLEVRRCQTQSDEEYINCNNFLAWLEKHETSYTKKDVDDAYVEGMVFAKNELEKQGEKKPIDKIQLGKKYKCIASPRYSTFMIGEIYKPEDKFLCSLMNLCYECFELIEDSEQKPTDEDVKEALRTEYEKGRADAFAQIQKEWSEEDEVKINRIVACLENLNVADNDILLKDVDWLKSLKDRYTWKPSSELDETSYQVGIKRVLENPESYGLTKYNWKPSDEQMHAFEQVYDWYNNNFAPSETLTSLYKDLEKLKGE